MSTELADPNELAPAEMGIDTTEEVVSQELAQAGQTQVEVAVKIVPEKGKVILAPSKKDKALTEGIHNIGMQSYDIPDEAGQLAGFEVEDAATLVQQYPQLKYMEEKGTPRT